MITAKSGFKVNMTHKLPWFLLLVFVITKLLWHGFSTPFVDVHWDSVIHLYQAKLFSETAFIQNYAQQASAIAAEVTRPWVNNDWPEHYWHFGRLGHIVLLGTVVKIFGSGAEGIVAAHWLHHILMALTMVFAVLCVTTLVNYLDTERSQQVVLWSAVGSAVLYMISNIYAYMGRCLVSEGPTLLLLTIAVLLLITGLKRQSVFWSCCSGFFAFLTHSFRLESIWLYIAFCIVLAAMLWIRRGSMQWLRAYACAGSVAFACYLLYAWYFYPLTNPYLFILFAKSQPPWRGGIPIYMHISVAGGLLWTGVFVSIIAASCWTTARMALAWVGTALLPSIPYFLQNLSLSPPYRMQLQTRMLVIILFLPLLFSSTLGWAYVWEYRKRGLSSIFFAVVSLTVLLIALSSARLSMLPGLREIRYVRTFLMVPAGEQTTYQFDEWHRISQVLYSQNNPVFLVFDWDSLRHEENLDLLRFFAPAYSPQTNPLNDVGAFQCEERMPTLPTPEKVSYCFGMTPDRLQRLTERGVTVFSLTSISKSHDTTMPFAYREVLCTQNYRLELIKPL